MSTATESKQKYSVGINGKLAERQCEKCGGDIGIIRSLSKDGYFALGCVSGGHVQQYIGSDADDFPRRARA